MTRPHTHSCVPLTDSCVCSSRAACPCTHLCVCRRREVRSHTRTHTHVCVTAGNHALAHTYTVCREWVARLHTLAHTHVYADPGRCVRTSAHTLVCVHRQGNMPLRIYTHAYVCVEARGALTRPDTHLCVPLTHSCVCSSRAACPCTHLCVCRNREVRSHTRAHVHTRVSAQPHAVCKHWVTRFHTPAYTYLHAELGRCVCTPAHILTHVCASTGQHVLAHTHVCRSKRTC